MAVFSSSPVPLSSRFHFPSLPLSLFPYRLPRSSLPPPLTQGDEPLNSDDDDEDSDGEGAHFDTEVDIFSTLSASLRRYIALQNIVVINIQDTVLPCFILGFSHEQTSKLVKLQKA